MSRAPAVAHAFAIAQAMLRLFATPKTTPVFPAKTCWVITGRQYAGLIRRKVTVAAVYLSRRSSAKADDRRIRVIPTEVEEWSEWDERHGRLRREGSGERVGRRTSSISYY